MRVVMSLRFIQTVLSEHGNYLNTLTEEFEKNLASGKLGRVTTGVTQHVPRGGLRAEAGSLGSFGLMRVARGEVPFRLAHFEQIYYVLASRDD